MELPLIRPGKVDQESPESVRLVVLFRNSSQGNMVIQQLGILGVRGDRIGVTGPERMPNGQGMLLSIGCPSLEVAKAIEKLCLSQGAEVQRQRVRKGIES